MRRMAYVLSHGFSGSTLMAHLLGAHADVATVGETSITEGIDKGSYRCSCGQLIQTCSFWKQITEEMKVRGLEFDVSRPDLRFRSAPGTIADRLLRAGPRGKLLESLRRVGLSLLPGPRTEWQRLLSRNEAFVESVVAAMGGSTFLDTSKDGNRLLHLMSIPSLDIYVIRLVRDARAVTYSCVKNLGMDVADAARSWLHEAEASERMKRLFSPNRWLNVRHEDVCGSPKETLSRICAFVELESDASVPNLEHTQHHIIGNRMRLASSLEIRLDERWRSILSPAQLRKIERIAGRANARYGYS